MEYFPGANSDRVQLLPEIVYLDNHLLAVAKPAGMPSQPDASGDTSIAEWAREYIRQKFAKPGNVYMALLHRLDRPTSGIVLLARTDKAAGRMSELFRRREVDKRYLALVECDADPGEGAVLHDWLIPAANGGMRRAGGKGEGAREAKLSYRTLGRNKRRALLAVDLETGVKHQIRCQLAAIGLPVAGDFRYGPFERPARPEPVMGGRAVLLHAWRVGFVHPVRRERLDLTLAPPGHWGVFLGAMPGVLRELS